MVRAWVWKKISHVFHTSSDRPPAVTEKNKQKTNKKTGKKQKQKWMQPENENLFSKLTQYVQTTVYVTHEVSKVDSQTQTQTRPPSVIVGTTNRLCQNLNFMLNICMFIYMFIASYSPL